MTVLILLKNVRKLKTNNKAKLFAEMIITKQATIVKII